MRISSPSRVAPESGQIRLVARRASRVTLNSSYLPLSRIWFVARRALSPDFVARRVSLLGPNPRRPWPYMTWLFSSFSSRVAFGFPYCIHLALIGVGFLFVFVFLFEAFAFVVSLGPRTDTPRYLVGSFVARRA